MSKGTPSITIKNALIKERTANGLNASCKGKCAKDDSDVSGLGDYGSPSTMTWNSKESVSLGGKTIVFYL
jgi:hypothetical protein